MLTQRRVRGARETRSRALRTSAPTADTASPSSPAARTSRVPTITPSAPGGGGGRRLLGRRDPEADRDRHRRCSRAARATTRGEPVRRPDSLAGRAGHRDRVEEARGPAPRSGARRSSGVVGATSGTSASPRSSHAASAAGGLLERQVGHDQPARAGREQRVGEALEPAREDQVGVAHDDHRDVLGDRAPDLEHRGDASRRPAARPSRRRGSPGRRRAGRRTGRRARSDRRRPRRRRARSAARSSRSGSRPSGTASAPRAGRWPERDSNASAIRSTAGHARPRCVERLGQVLVAAAREADEVELARAVGERPGERVRALERRDDPLEPGGQRERVQRLRRR